MHFLVHPCQDFPFPNDIFKLSNVHMQNSFFLVKVSLTNPPSSPPLLLLLVKSISKPTILVPVDHLDMAQTGNAGEGWRI